MYLAAAAAANGKKPELSRRYENFYLPARSCHSGSFPWGFFQSLLAPLLASDGSSIVGGGLAPEALIHPAHPLLPAGELSRVHQLGMGLVSPDLAVLLSNMLEGVWLLLTWTDDISRHFAWRANSKGPRYCVNKLCRLAKADSVKQHLSDMRMSYRMS